MNTLTVNVEGMMCAHCEAHVKKALEALGLTVTEVSHEKGIASVSSENTIDEKTVIAAIEGEGYKTHGTVRDDA